MELLKEQYAAKKIWICIAVFYIIFSYCHNASHAQENR